MPNLTPPEQALLANSKDPRWLMEANYEDVCDLGSLAERLLNECRRLEREASDDYRIYNQRAKTVRILTVERDRARAAAKMFPRGDGIGQWTIEHRFLGSVIDNVPADQWQDKPPAMEDAELILLEAERLVPIWPGNNQTRGEEGN
jgi:hypothetical protein